MIEMENLFSRSFGCFFKDIDDFNCICPSQDENGDFLFVGSNGYISCVDTAAMSRIDRIDLTDDASEHKSIAFIMNIRIKPTLYLVVSISSTGALYLHLFSINKFYPIDWVSTIEFHWEWLEHIIQSLNHLHLFEMIQGCRQEIHLQRMWTGNEWRANGPSSRM